VIDLLRRSVTAENGTHRVPLQQKDYPAPREWAKTAAPFLLKINSADNGKQLTMPIAEI
jgi:hypothetical protein